MLVSSKVPAQYKNLPIVEYLAQRFSYMPADIWLERVNAGNVTCNDQTAIPETIVRQADVVSCQIPDFTPPSINLDYQIIYEDDWLLAVNKPPNLRVHGDGKWTTANLIYHLRHQHQPPYPSAHLINRLDANTSGVLLLAKSAEFVPKMSQLFLEQQVEKTYHALVHNVPNPKIGIIDRAIGRSAISRIKVRQSADNPRKPKPATTHYRTLQQWEERFSWLELRPKTGRTHQLRVHLAWIGCPIVGDALYNLSDEAFEAYCQDKNSVTMLMARQALHSYCAQFQHPFTGENLSLQAEMPADIVALIESLNKEKGIS